MKSSLRSSYILNLPFVIGLLLLLINDHYLKGALGNWLTGKLSDVAGILILPLFLKFVFMKSNRFSIITTLLLFVFWKSPFSSFLIELYNSISPISIFRVVDYSDFIAFIILPFSYYILKHIDDYSFHLKANHQWASSLLFVATTFSFIATSPPDDYRLYDSSGISNCCIDRPTIGVAGNGSIFIPNIFTPDGDGINDFFQIIVDTGIARIDTFEIWRTDSSNDSLIFFKENITDITPTSGWDGTFNDTIVPAQYLYDIRIVSTDNIKARYRGYFCCIPCNQPTGMVTPLNLENCGFATQYDPVTKTFDSDTPSLEQLDCFE